MSRTANFYVETRLVADRTQTGSRWSRTISATDESTARAEYETLARMPDQDARLVRLDWEPDGDEDSMPLTTVVCESRGEAVAR